MGHADFEIEALFSKFDVDGDRILNEEEVGRMKEELEEDEVNSSLTNNIRFSSYTIINLFQFQTRW